MKIKDGLSNNILNEIRTKYAPIFDVQYNFKLFIEYTNYNFSNSDYQEYKISYINKSIFYQNSIKCLLICFVQYKNDFFLYNQIEWTWIISFWWIFETKRSKLSFYKFLSKNQWHFYWYIFCHFEKLCERTIIIGHYTTFIETELDHFR